MLNHITIMGRLVRDPELRHTQNSKAVTSFTLAVDRDFKNQDGQREADFIDCVAWGQTAEFVCQYLSKGRMTAVSGRLQLRDWTDKDGKKRRTAEVIADSVYFADSKPNDAGGKPASAPAGGGYTLPPAGTFQEIADENNGDLPF